MNNRQFYLGTLNQEEIKTLNNIVENGVYPAHFKWSDYPLPEPFIDEIIAFVNLAINNKGNKGMKIRPGAFQPTPTKAPPPRYLKVGNEIVEIKQEYDSINSIETLDNKSLYSFIVDEVGVGVKIKINYNHPQFEIEYIVLSQYNILYDVADLNIGTTLFENKLVIVKLKTRSLAPILMKEFTLATNPLRLSIAAMINVPVSIFNEVKNNNKSFHIYRFN